MALDGIVYVLRKGVAGRDVPAQIVGCSGVTAWRPLRDWTEAAVWLRLHEVLPAQLRVNQGLDMDDWDAPLTGPRGDYGVGHDDG